MAAKDDAGEATKYDGMRLYSSRARGGLQAGMVRSVGCGDAIVSVRGGGAC